MADKPKNRATGYDKYVSPKLLGIAIGVFVLILSVPTPKSIIHVGVEYALGERYVLDFLSEELFHTPFAEASLWQSKTAEVLEAAMRQGAPIAEPS